MSGDLNQITSSLDKEIGRNWDKKREHFHRRRLMSYLIEDRSAMHQKAPKNDSRARRAEPPREGWQADAYPITDKQNLVMFSSYPCHKRSLAVRIRVQVLRMLHYLPAVIESDVLGQTPCKNIMLDE